MTWRILNSTVWGDKDWNAQFLYFGRFNYDYAGRYLLEANLRYDGTSVFGADQRWRWYPSFSAGWRVSEEAFMQSIKEAVSALKLRASWGKSATSPCLTHCMFPLFLLVLQLAGLAETATYSTM